MTDTSDLMGEIDLTGFSPLNESSHRIDEKALRAFLRLRDNADRLSPGRLHAAIEEAVSSADFPIFTQYVTQREVIARYRVMAPDWLPTVKTETNNTFLNAEKLWTTGIPQLLPEQAEGQERHEVYQSELKTRRALKKYGAKSKITFEMLVNDTMGALQDMPQQFAEACRFSEAYRLAELLVTSTGLNSDMISDTARAPVYDEDGALVTDARNPTVDNLLDSSHDALTMDHLKLAIKQMAAMEIPGPGNVLRRMGLRARYLVIPPALELDAEEILGATTVAYAATAASAVPLTTVNAVAKYGLQVVVNEALPLVNTSASGDTQWFLLPDPARGSAIYMTRLKGMENPQIFMKQSNKASTGGGALGVQAGDFDTDDVEYACRHIFRANRGDPRFIIGALGDTA